MKFPRRNFLLLAAGVAALPGVSSIAWAQTYPSRPITMIAPFAAGGPTDTVARILADRMRRSLGQAIIVENVVGAGGSIGVGRVARSNPDGYTIVVGNWGTFVVIGAIYTLQYDLVKDFDPILPLVTEPTVVVAKKAHPAINLRELVAWLKANPGKGTMGTSGLGGPSHIFGMLFRQVTEADVQLVPYRGAGPAVQDLAAGQIDMMITGPTIVLALARAGTIKTFAVNNKTRLASAPEIPTVDEAGLPGLYFSVWHGLWAPKGTPKDVIAKLNAAASEALADETVKQRFADIGQDIWPRDGQTPAALAALQKAEIERWWPVVKSGGIKAQ